MRVLLTTAYSTLLDGVNRHVQVLAPALNAMSGLDLKVLTFLPPGELSESLEKDGVPVVSLGVHDIRDLRGLWRLLKLLRTFNPDVVHVETPVMMVYAAVLICKVFGSKIKLIETIHGIADKRPRQRERRNIRDMLYQWFRSKHDAMIYISKGVYESRKGMAPIETFIYNPMKFKAVEKSDVTIQSVLGVSTDTPVIGTACRIAAVKRPESFVKVMVGVLERVPAAHAVVLGDGPADVVSAAKRIAEGSSAQARIHFLGYRPDAKRLMQTFSCFVMTSAREGMPTALLEAISQKIPVAFWDGEGGLRDLAELQKIDGPIGVVAEQGDIAGLVNGIVGLIEDKAKARSVSENAFLVGQKRFNVDDVKMQTVEFYRKVCERG